MSLKSRRLWFITTLALYQISLGALNLQAKPIWIYKELTKCDVSTETNESEIDTLPAQQLAAEKLSLEDLGIPVLSAETNLKNSEGVLPEDSPCKAVDRALKCFMIDEQYRSKARRAGFKESKGRWKDCGRAPQKRRVH